MSFKVFTLSFHSSFGITFDIHPSTLFSVLKIQSWMFEMNRTQSDLVDMFSIGKSYEGRPLYVLQVGEKA